MVVAVVQWSRSAELLPGTLTSSYVVFFFKKRERENGKSKKKRTEERVIMQQLGVIRHEIKQI